MFSLKDAMMNEVTIRRIRKLGDSKPTLWASQAAAVNEDGEIYGKCLRSSYYYKEGIKETNPVSDAVTIMGYMGCRIEDGLIDLMKNQGVWENNSVRWEAKGLSGEVDAIARFHELNPENGKMEEKIWVVECKSCSGYFANKEVYGYNSGRGDNKVWTPGKPKDPHLMQSAIYADISRGKCEGCIVIYVSRDEAKLAEFRVVVEENGDIYINGVKELRFNMVQVYERYGQLRHHLENSILPECDYRHTYTNEEVEEIYTRKGLSAAAKKGHLDGSKPFRDPGCMYCNYRDKCISDGLHAVSDYQTKVDTSTAPVSNPLAGDFSFFETASTPLNAEERPDYMSRGAF